MAFNRAAAIDSLGARSLDVLVIGGGIVGSGIARDAALRGLRVGLIEQHDFAFGTSSRSSRLLHGGLRYLAQGRIGLVREASVEKKIIHRIAPHLTAPLPFVFPTYRHNRDWKLWQLKIGVKIYDLLCSGRNLGASTWLDKREILGRFPALNVDGLQGAVRYYDGFTNDARLTIDTLRSAARADALLANYTRFTGAQRDASNLWQCAATDVLTGVRMNLAARTVVNATGPWADGLPRSRVKLRLTKGIHLVVDRSRLAVPETLVMTEGKRILFAIPWGERTILGTTDTDFEGSPDAVSADADDIEHVLRVTNDFFPDAKLQARDVISVWAGLRPLVADPNGNPSDISRAHEIVSPEPGWWDVTGGKLTTYRLMAEQTVDQLVRWLVRAGVTGKPFQPCCTAEAPLLPAFETEQISGILPPECNQRVVEHYCANEWAVHLEDIMVRRTNWHYYRRDAADMAGRVAECMAECLGWTYARQAEELRRYHGLAGCLVRRESASLAAFPACDKNDAKLHPVV